MPIDMTDRVPSPFGTEYSPNLARVLILLSPVMFVLCYALSWIQSAEPWVCLLISAVGGAGLLFGAAIYRLRGAKAASDARWIMVVVSALAAWFANR